MTSQTKIISLVIFSIVLVFANAEASDNNIGGFQEVCFKTWADLCALTSFEEADKLARETYYAEWGTELGSILKVYSQIVSGINYKIVYQTMCVEKFYFVVYTQAWTNTVKIIEFGNYWQ